MSNRVLQVAKPEESLNKDDGREKNNVIVPTKIDEILQHDSNDESLQRYKLALLGTAALGDLGDVLDSRRLVVEKFKVVFQDGTASLEFNLATPDGVEKMKTTCFSMLEGTKYKFELSFRVNTEILNGLRYINQVKRGLFSEKEELVLGSYGPQSLPHNFVFPRWGWAEAPKGLLYRGKYHSFSKFIDLDGVTHLEFEYHFEIKKSTNIRVH